MNAAPQKDANCTEERKAKIQHLESHIKSGLYQVDVFRVAQAILNHVEEGVDKGADTALAFHLKQTDDEDDIAALLA